MIKKGLTVFVVTPLLPRLPRFEVIDHVPVHRLGLPIPGPLGSLAFFFHALLWLMLRRDNYDVLHAHIASSPAVAAGIVSLVVRKPAILKFAGSRKTGDIATSRATLHGRLKLAFLKRSIDRFVCPSAEIREELVRNGFDGGRITVMPNGVDTGSFAPASSRERDEFRRQEGLPPEAMLVIYAGRLAAGKGVEFLLQAWQAVEQRTGAYLLVIGAGPIEQALRSAAAGLGRVRFLGWRSDIDRCLRCADLFVLPSLGEGLPNALIEAMSCGLACAATRIGGVTDLIEDRVTGILAEPGDVLSLRSALERLITDPGLRAETGKRAREYVVNNLAIERIAEKYAGIYRQLNEHAER